MGYNYGQIIKIGESLLKVYKQQNYRGKEVDDFFSSDEWNTFMKEHVKPVVTIFDRYLCGIDPRIYLEKKATFSEEFGESGIGLLDQILLCDDIPEQKYLVPLGIEDDINEHMVLIDPQFIDSNAFQIPIQHDIEDLLREINE